MSRIILALVLLVFFANTANASVLMTCCPSTQKATEKADTPPCHGHQKSSMPTPEKKPSGCLCAYTCVAKIILNIPYLSQELISLHQIYPLSEHDEAISFIISPESPPPKA